MEVGDTFVPHIVVSFPLASNDLILRCSYPLIIHDCHLIIILCAPLESLGSNVKDMAVSKVIIYKIHAQKFGMKAILRDVFFKYLQARY